MELQSKRHQGALNYALSQISRSPIAPYVETLLLFGSCAKKTEHFESDIDLFLELSEHFPKTPEMKMELIRLKAAVSTGSLNDPETDLKIVIGSDWRKSNMLFYQNILTEGINIWH